MKKIFVFIVVSKTSCSSLTLVSPGITSEHRLNQSSNLKFEESSFYGTNIYQLNGFYIEKENTNLVLNDPNNIHHSKFKDQFEANISEEDILILVEVCFDKDKFKQRTLDLDLYQFELNGNPSIDTLEVIYPYSFRMKGNRYQLERPILINENYPNQKNVIKTADEFVTCSRTFLKFKKEFQKDGKNILKIMTPRKSVITLDFYIHNGNFLIQKSDDIELKVKVKSEV